MNRNGKTMWETQAGKFTNSNKVNIYFCLTEFSATKKVTCKCHMEESNKGRYDMILGRDLVTAPVLDLRFYNNAIVGREGPYLG